MTHPADDPLRVHLERMLMAQDGVPLNAIQFGRWVDEARAALAAAPQPAPAPADERAAMAEAMADASEFCCYMSDIYRMTDALLVKGFGLRGGAEAGLREAVKPCPHPIRYDQGLCCGGQCFDDPPAALARPSAPETVCHAQEGIGRMECHKCRKSWALDDPRLPPCREDEA